MGKSYIRRLIDACAAAFQLLTRIPVPYQPRYNEEVYRRSVVFYPLVGMVIGAVLMILYDGLPLLLPAEASAVLLLIVWIMLTGGLHLDGWMDTADGLLSHCSRERKLEIMKDSRVGAMGVIACVCYLLLKAALLHALIKASVVRLLPLWIIPIWSRFLMTAAIAWWPYARGEQGGMGALVQQAGNRHVLPALFTAVASSYLLWTLSLFIADVGLPLNQFTMFLIGAIVLTFTLGLGAAYVIGRKLGGQTGDTYGALNEWMELILLLAAVVAAVHVPI